jgi:hypothetical protein
MYASVLYRGLQVGYSQEKAVADISLGCQNQRLTVYIFYYQLPFAYCTGQATYKPLYTELRLPDIKARTKGVTYSWVASSQFGSCVNILIAAFVITNIPSIDCDVTSFN